MLTFRYLIRLIAAFISKFKLLIFLGILAGVFFFVFLKFLSPLVWGKSTEKIGLIGKYRVDNLPTSILKMIGGGLTKTDESGLPEPDLASSWETPDKGKTWIFHLKDNIYWQDGKKVISSGIIYEFSDLTIERPDAKTIIFKLQNPFSPFPSVVARPTFKKGLLGTGLWRVSGISVSGNYVQQITLVDKERNRQIYKFYPTEERAKLAFELGEVDKLIDVFNPKPFDTWKKIVVNKQINLDRFVAVFFNTRDKSLSDKTLRQALAYAIEKNYNETERAISPLSPNSWAYNPQVKLYNYDPEKARKTIEEFPDEAKNNLSFGLVTTPILLNEAEKISKSWNAIGVKTTVQVSSNIPSEYQALIAIFDIPDDPDQYSVWHSTQESTNISKYQNPRIDKLLEDGRTELDLEARKKIYLDFQRFLVEDSPAIFLYHPISYTIIRK